MVHKMYFNIRLLFWIIVYSILITLGIWTINDNLMLSIGIILIGGLLLLGYIIVFPSNFCIDQTGITFYFAFIFKIRAEWNELHVIEDHYCSTFPWMREYHIGYLKTKFILWKKVVIPKNKKISIQIERHYKKTIEKIG